MLNSDYYKENQFQHFSQLEIRYTKKTNISQMLIERERIQKHSFKD
jgi:hypothetical protein